MSMPRIPNKHRKKSTVTAVTMTQVAMEILKPILNAAKERGVKLGGQMMVDHPKCGKFPLVFFAQPNGSHLCWFVEDGMHQLYSLVNEIERKVLDIPSDHHAEFQAELKRLQLEMGEVQ